MDLLRDNIRRVREQIEAAAHRAGREAAEITLVAVTKTVPIERVEAAVRAGLSVLGENRVQEAREKIEKVSLPVEWHLVGHLQTNKARIAAGLFTMIHSVDSGPLARRLEQACEGRSGPLDVLIQVNVSGEATKHGVSPQRLRAVAEEVSDCGHLRLRGLMTIAPFSASPELSRPHFARLRELAEQAASWRLAGLGDELSMGMTEDFPVAIEEGATLVRIGRALFGERPS